MSLRRKLFYGLTVATILLLLFLPATSWLAQQQLLLSSPREDRFSETAWSKAASQHPGDFALQFASALRAGTNTERIASLESLRNRFPQEGAVSAALLKTLCKEAPGFQRAEEDSLLPPRVSSAAPSGSPPGFAGPAGSPPGFGGPGGSSPAPRVQYIPPPVKQIAPEALAKFEAIAAEGEKLEPDNSFFPAFLAAWYFEAHRDADALAAWKRAASKTDWNDHSMDDWTAKIKLLQAVSSKKEVGFVPRAILWTAEEFPEYPGIRFASRVVIAKAVAAELAGDKETGISLRRCTRQIAETMQTRSKDAVGNLVGANIIGVSLVRAGGVPAIDYRNLYDDSRLQNLEHSREDAITYLKRIGQAEEAIAVSSAVDSAVKTRKFFRERSGKSYIGFSDKSDQLRFSWLRCALCITGAVFSLVFAVIFGLIFRFSPRLQKGEPLQSSARWGVSVGVLGPILAFVVATGMQGLFQNDWKELVTASGIMGLGMLIIPPILCRLSWRQIGHGILMLLVTLAVMAGISSIFLFIVPPFYHTASLMEPQTLSMPDEHVLTFAESVAIFLLPFVYFGLQVIVPLLMLSIFALFSSMLRIPIAAGVTRGMRAMAVPLACLFVFGYVACFFTTLHHENAAIAEMDRVVAVGERHAYEEIIQSR